MQHDSIGKTLGVAIGVCVVCSVLVSSAAVLLRPRQEENLARDRMENILVAAGATAEQLNLDNEALAKVFEGMIDVEVADLEADSLLAEVDENFVDERTALKSPELSQAIPAEKDIAGIKRRARQNRIYVVRKGDKLQRVILPVHGKGLWSTMYGYLALGPDCRTVESLAFYEHGETPGLGAEIDNPRWRALWIGKKVFDDEGKPRIEVIKGTVNPEDPGAQYEVDGISGATITGRGVMNLVRYWVGKDGYGPILDELREKEAAR